MLSYPQEGITAWSHDSMGKQSICVSIAPSRVCSALSVDPSAGLHRLLRHENKEWSHQQTLWLPRPLGDYTPPTYCSLPYLPGHGISLKNTCTALSWKVTILFLGLIQFNITFSVTSTMSGWCLHVADIILPHWNAIMHALIMAPHLVTFYSRQRVNRPCVLDLSFTYRALSKEASSTILKVFGMTRLRIEPTTSHTPGERSTTRLLYHEEIMKETVY